MNDITNNLNPENPPASNEGALSENQANTRPRRWHPAMVILHWSVAALVFTNLLIGVVIFPNYPGRFVTGLHIIVGSTTLLLMLIRIFVRIFTHRPAWASTGSRFLDVVGELTHYALYVLVILVTIFGFLYSSESGTTQSIFMPGQAQGFKLLGQTDILGIPLLVYHRLLAYLLAFLLILHIGAALFHEIIKKDRLISRMTIKRNG